MIGAGNGRKCTGTTLAKLQRRERVILYEGVLEMKRNLKSAPIALATLILAGTGAVAQTSEPRIEVKVIPAPSVEERVANDLKEKELRQAAEAKRNAAA